MVKHFYIQQKSFRFRRFCRAAYAAFRSMHREVTIGRVAGYIADRQMRKSVAVAALALPLLLATSAQAQSDDDLEGLTLPVVTITAAGDTAASSEGACAVLTHQDIQQLTATTVGELLEALPGVDLRTRGVADMQGDITLRGGTFDQVVVLLNGVNISDPQTGHYNLDIPIDLSMVDRVELLSAAALVRYGIASFCGGINIVTGQTSRDRLRASLACGSYGTAAFSVGGDKRVGRWTLSANGAYNRSDGYRTNTDYRNANAFLQAQRRDASGAWQMQIGGQTKDFGSQSFYSFAYPDQFEATRTLTAAVQRQQRIGQWHTDMALYGRLHKDRFELFRDDHSTPAAWYTGHNYHLSSVAGARLRASRLWQAGRTTMGVEYRRDGIISNVLGDSLDSPRKVRWESGDHYYTVGKERHHGSAFVEHSVYLNHWQLSAALQAHDNSLSGSGYGYALAAEWLPSEQWRLSASVGRSDRQPTFTDLYYHSATQVSNPLLATEVSRMAELAASFTSDGWYALANAYLRQGSDIIDWIRQPAATVWYSMNHSRVDALGGDLRLGYRSQDWLRRIEAGYAYCTLRQKADGYVSRYALDYLRHKLLLSAAVSPVKNWQLKLSGEYHYRIGSYTDAAGALVDYDPVLLLNATVSYQWKAFTLFVEGRNLLNRTYCDYGGIPLPSTTFMSGLRLDL